MKVSRHAEILARISAYSFLEPVCLSECDLCFGTYMTASHAVKRVSYIVVTYHDMADQSIYSTPERQANTCVKDWPGNGARPQKLDPKDWDRCSSK